MCLFVLCYISRIGFISIFKNCGCCGQGSTSRAVRMHDIATTLDSNVIDFMPAVHALTGFDTTSEIGTKKAALGVNR